MVTGGGTQTAVAAKAASKTTPIVFVIGADPVKFGLVASLNRPGGNVTGVSSLTNILLTKQLEVLLEAVPAAALVGFLINPASPNAQPDITELRAAAEAVGRSSHIAFYVENECEPGRVQQLRGISSQQTGLTGSLRADQQHVAGNSYMIEIGV